MCLLGSKLFLCNYFFLYSRLASNVFLQSYYGGDRHIIDDDSLGRRYDISNNVYAHSGVVFSRSMNISIKELQFYTFKKEEPFQKISNNTFRLVNKIENIKSHRYYLKVMRIDSCCWKIRVLFINQESTKVSLSCLCFSVKLRTIYLALQFKA